jgi:Beta-lactamase class C and other penicillin binding proteins
MWRLASLAVAAALLAPLAAQSTFAGSAALDRAIEEAIRRDQIPGAVLLVSHQGQVVHRKAYGARALTPRREAMTVDTIFDVASLTKVVATTPAVMKLFEEGKLRLNDRVTQYLPEFQGGTSEITVRQLLTHFSGLRPDLDLQPPWSGYKRGSRRRSSTSRRPCLGSASPTAISISSCSGRSCAGCLESPSPSTPPRSSSSRSG